jgi:anti-sigma B factor antagonist
MELITERQSERCTISLIGPLRIDTVADINQKVAEEMGDASEIQLSLAGVSDIDSSGMQLLIYMKVKYQNTVRKFSYTDASSNVISYAEILNITDLLTISRLTESAVGLSE